MKQNKVYLQALYYNLLEKGSVGRTSLLFNDNYERLKVDFWRYPQTSLPIERENIKNSGEILHAERKID